MSQDQDAETVARLEALDEKATPGPWGAIGARVYAIPSEPMDATSDDEPVTLADFDMDQRVDHDTGACPNADLAAQLRTHALPLIRSLSTRLAAAEAREAANWLAFCEMAERMWFAIIWDVAEGDHALGTTSGARFVNAWDFIPLPIREVYADADVIGRNMRMKQMDYHRDVQPTLADRRSRARAALQPGAPDANGETK